MKACLARASLVMSLVGCAAPRTKSAASESGSPPPNAASDSPARAPVTQHGANTPSGAPAGPASEAKSAGDASAAPSAAPSTPAPLHDADGKPLHQTEDRPHADSPAFLHRMQLLVRAIEAGDAKLAHDAFFPVVAYEQVKDIAKPALDHERRLLSAFARNVREYQRELGKDAQGIRFVRVEVPEDKVKWMPVGKEGNRVGYFRVLRSRLVVATAEGKERSFELTSMISWRGEWYVVHLHGFK